MSAVVEAPTIDMKAPQVPMTRLIAVEVRKLVNTRAGFWLVAAMAIISAIIMIALLIWGDASDGDLNYSTMFGLMNIPTGVLLPILAILLVTSEWSQRTGLVTFTLEPKRPRIVLAKLAASLIAAAGAVLVALAFGALGTALAGVFRDGGGQWDLGWTEIGQATMLQVISLLEGFAFGMLVMVSAAAIVLFFALPTIWSIVGTIVPWISDHIQKWADLALAEAPFQGGTVNGGAWAHLATSGAIWVALPLAVGVWRLLRSEVK